MKAKSDSSEAKLLGFGKMCYEQGKDDGRKQTLEEVLKEYKKLIDKAPTISHKDSIDFGCGLEHKIKVME